MAVSFDICVADSFLFLEIILIYSKLSNDRAQFIVKYEQIKNTQCSRLDEKSKPKGLMIIISN
jgi:hypothetical protein